MKWINSDVKSIKVNGVAPSQQTVLDTSFPLARKMYMITAGTPKGLARRIHKLHFKPGRTGDHGRRRIYPGSMRW